MTQLHALQGLFANFSSDAGQSLYSKFSSAIVPLDNADAARNAYAEAQVDREFGGFLLATAGPAGMVAAAPAASTALGGSYLAKFGIGGTINLAYTELSSRVFSGTGASWSNRFSSFVAGGLFAPGVAGFRAGGLALNGTVNGGLAGLTSNTLNQGIDLYTRQRTSLSLTDVLVATGIGALAGRAGAKVPGFLDRFPSLGNAQKFWTGVQIGGKVQLNDLPSTIISTTAQAYADAGIWLFGPSPKH